MKKLLIFLMFVFIFPSITFAQISIAFEAGANYGSINMIDNRVLNQEESFGVYISGTPKFRFHDRWQIFGEVQYSDEGTVINSNSFDNFKQVLRLHYIRIIPGLEFKVMDPLSLSAGFNMGYVALETWTTGSLTTINQFTHTDRYDLGFLFGLNVEKDNFGFSLNYNLGLRNLFGLTLTDINGGSIEQLDGRSRFVQAGVYYKFQMQGFSE